MEKNPDQEKQLDQLAQKAGDYEELFGSCAQGTLKALQEHFNLGDASSLKAATAMPGIALRGETCGAVIGAIMALGMALGRDKPEDQAALQRTIGAAREFCRQFEVEYGSCNCSDIHQKIFGRSFDLADPKEQQEFAKAEAIKKCRGPVEKAAGIAGAIILDLYKV